MGEKMPLKTDPVIRSYGFPDLSTNDEESYIEGHAAIYGEKTNIGGYFYEVIERGALDETNFDDVLFSTNHDLQKIPLARSRRNNGNSTLHLQVTEKGLHVRASLDTEGNPSAKELYSAIKRGDMDGMSFIFYIQDEKWEDLDSDMPTRRIQRIKRVMEVSAVNFPAYAGTDINARDQAALDNAVIALENARSQLDNSNNELELLKLKNKILMKG